MKSWPSKRSSSTIIIAAIMLAFSSCRQSNTNTGNDAASSKTTDGRQLFAINCSSCHAVKRELVGPALAGVETRWNNKALLYRFIKNSQEVIAKDAYAKSLFEKYNRSVMTPFPQLKDEDIDAILRYIKTESTKP